MNLSQLLIRVGDVASLRPAAITVLPDDLSLPTSGTKSLSDDTMTNMSIGDSCSKSIASIAKRISLEFLPDLLE